MNIISDWLEKHGDPEITEQVRREGKELNKLYEMGMYMYVTVSDIRDMSSVQDEELNELLKEARKIDDRILVSESYSCNLKKGYRGWLLGQIESTYTYQLYLEERAHDGSPYQARYVSCACDYKTIFAYLCGVINSAHNKTVQKAELPYSKNQCQQIVESNRDCYGSEFAGGMEKAFTMVNARILSKTAR